MIVGLAREVPAPPSARGAEGRHGGRAPARPEVTAVVLGISGIIMRPDVVLAKQKTEVKQLVLLDFPKCGFGGVLV